MENRQRSGGDVCRVLFVVTLLSSVGLVEPTEAGRCASEHLPGAMDRPDGFPSGPLTLIVPYGAGGGSGQLARAMTQAFTELTGVTINIEYKPGGSGRKGMDAFLSTPSDGNTILQHVDDAASAHALDEKRPNPAIDLAPLATVQVTFSQIYVFADEKRFADWNGLIAHAKEEGTSVRIATVSRKGSMERLNLRLMAEHYGLKIEPATFSAGRGEPDPAGKGPAHALLEQPGDVRQFLDSGKFRPILTLLPNRVPAFADTPSMSDAGLDFEPLLRFRSYFAKPDVPKVRLDWLKWAFQKAYCQPSFQAFNAKAYMHPTESFRDSAGTARLIDSTVTAYRKMQERFGLSR